ncbi:MAG: hypothetical protein WB792_02590 [Desulfobacterales bacterium]
MMKIDAANNWPMVVAALPGEKTPQNESTLPIFSQDHQRPAVSDHGPDIESHNFREKGSIIDLYI